jgi:uncharacterized membrane protein YkvI
MENDAFINDFPIKIVICQFAMLVYQRGYINLLCLIYPMMGNIDNLWKVSIYKWLIIPVII